MAAAGSQGKERVCRLQEGMWAAVRWGEGDLGVGPDGECFARARLPVGQDRGVEAAEKTVHQWGNEIREEVAAWGGRLAVDTVERERPDRVACNGNLQQR